MDTDVCKLAKEGEPHCPVAKGRFRAVLQSALQVIGSKFHLVPAAERFAQQEGLVAKLQLELAKAVKDSKQNSEIEAIRDEIAAAAKLAGRYAHECGVAAHVRGFQADDPSSVFGD